MVGAYQPDRGIAGRGVKRQGEHSLGKERVGDGFGAIEAFNFQVVGSSGKGLLYQTVKTYARVIVGGNLCVAVAFI